MEYLKNHTRRGLSVIIGLALIAAAALMLAPPFMHELAWNDDMSRDRMAQQAGNTTRSADTRGARTDASQAQASVAQEDVADSATGQRTEDEQDAQGGQTMQVQQETNQQGARGQNARGDHARTRAPAQQGGRGTRGQEQNHERDERWGGHDGGDWWRWLIGTPLQWAGIALIGGGLWFLSRRRMPPTPPTPPSEPVHPETYQPPEAA